MTRQERHLFEFGPFRADPNLRILLRDGKPVPAPPKAFDILLALLQNNDQLILKEDLMKAVWPDSFVEESNLTQNIFVLRKILGETAGGPRYIITLPRRGYRFAAEVRTVVEENERKQTVTEIPSALPPVIEVEHRTKQKALLARGWLLLAGSIMIIAIFAGLAALMYPLPLPRALRVHQLTHSGRAEPYSRVVTDGSRVYFTERMGGADVLAQAPVAGGEPTLISTSIPNLQLYDIDPDKSRLLIGAQSPDFNNPLWVMSTAGGSGRRLGDVQSSEGTAWSRDGHSIFYGQDERIYKVTDDGGEPSNLLLTAPGYVTSVRLSPDGGRLRFTVRDPTSGGNSLWEATADGQNLRPVSLGWKAAALQWGEGESYGDWSPDGRYFVFRSAHQGVESFWAIREKSHWPHWNASAPVQIYSSADHISEPRFSGDGKQLFFISYQGRRELVRYDSAQKIFVPYLSGIPARHLSFSPDGKWAAYRNEVDGTLWRIRVDGSDKLQLTYPPMDAYHSSWSADGRRIVFGGRLPGVGGHLYSVPVDGGNPEPLWSRDSSDGEPDFSPDGRQIVFERWQIGRVALPPEIYVLDLNTGKTSVIPGSKGFEGVHWSPDGKYLTASDQINHRLMLFDFSGLRWSELSEGTPYGWGLRWSSDSRYVYYQHPDQGEEQPIFRVRIRDRKIEQITSARQILRTDVLGYTMTGLTPGNEPLATLVHRNSDIYVLDLDLP